MELMDVHNVVDSIVNLLLGKLWKVSLALTKQKK